MSDHNECPFCAAGVPLKQPAPEKSYELWMEGWDATIQRENAKYLGTYKGRTFEEACASWARESLQPSYYNPANNTYWGCRFFDNEADARKSFG